MRGIQGLGAALVLPAALSIVMNMFAEGAERNKALGIWGGGGRAGRDGRLASRRRAHHLRRVAVHLLLQRPHRRGRARAGPQVVPESRLRSARRRYDPFGARHHHRRAVVIVYAISQAPQVGWAPLRPWPCSRAAAALARGVLRHRETRAEAPLLPLRAVPLQHGGRSPTRSGFLLAASFFTFVFLGTLYMQQVLGFSALADRGRLADGVGHLGGLRRPSPRSWSPGPRPRPSWPSG